MDSLLNLVRCSTDSDFLKAKQLTQDYFDWLGMDLTFQNVKKEYSIFHQMYGNPSGAFFIAYYNDAIAGGVGVRKIMNEVCEMKRLFVYDNFRGKKLGLQLCNKVISCAKELGYFKMRLDTVERLKEANKLYESIGFYEIPPYYHNPDKTARFMELKLR